MVEGGGTDGAGSAERPGGARAHSSAAISDAVNGRDALPVDTSRGPPAVEKEAREGNANSVEMAGATDGNDIANGGELPGDRDTDSRVLIETAGDSPSVAQQAAIAVEAPRSAPSLQMLPLNSRMMDLTLILSAQVADEEAAEPATGFNENKESGEDGANVVEMDGERVEVDVEMAEPGPTTSVAAVMTEPKVIHEDEIGQIAESTGVGVVDYEMETPNAAVNVQEPVAAENDRNDQVAAPEQQSTVTLTTTTDGATLLDGSAADSDEPMGWDEPTTSTTRLMDGYDGTDQRSATTETVMMKNPPVSSVSVNESTAEQVPAVGAQADGQEQSPIGVLGMQESTVKADNDAAPENATSANSPSAPGRSTRSSRKKSSHLAKIKDAPAAATPASTQLMYADLTLETVSGGDDVTTAATTGKVASKKRSQRAPPKAATVTPARATKRSRTREKQVAAGAEKDNQEDDEVMVINEQSAPALPPRSRSRKRRQMTEESDLFEPPPIIDNPPPLPFTTHSSRRPSSHSASPNRGAPLDRPCEFCNHAVDMCALLICKACRRAYHVRCLIKRFKEYWPAEGSIETRLKKLQEEARDRRASLFRCSSCRAAFAEFVDTQDKYLEPCTCPTCAQPELLATFRRNKLFQMLLEMNKAKAMGKQGVSSKVSTASVTSDASADSGSGETKKKPSRLTRGTSTDQDAGGSTVTCGGAARRKSSRPIRRSAVSNNDSDATNENSVEDVSTGFSTAENSPSKQPATDVSAPVSEVTLTNAETALVMDDSTFGLTELSLADSELSQPAPVAVAAEKSGADSTSLGPRADISDQKGAKPKKPKMSDNLLNLVELRPDEGMVQFPFVCLRHRLDGSDASKRADGDARFFSVRKLRESKIGSGQCSWSVGKIQVRCSCCDDVMPLTAFAKHVGLIVADAKAMRNHLLVVHRDGLTGSRFEPLIRALNLRSKLPTHSSVEAAFVSVPEDGPATAQNSGMPQEVSAQDEADILNIKIPRKKKPAATADKAVNSGADTNRDQFHQGADLLNGINAGIEREVKQKVSDASAVEAAFQQVKEVMLVKRNRNSMMSQAIHDAADTDTDPLDYLLKVVSLHHNYLAVTADGATRDRMFELPPGAAMRRVGWLALSASRRFCRSIYCECCEKALSVAKFIAHSGLNPDGNKHLGLYVMERVSPGRVQSFARFCRNAAIIARAGGDKAFTAVLEHLQEFPAASSAPTNAAAS